MNLFQPIHQRGAARIDEKSKQVKVEAVMEGVQLQAGDKFYGKLPRDTESFLHIVHGIVVREGNCPKASFAGHLEDLPGRMLPIRGSAGVNVQVNHRMILVENRGKIYFNPHSLSSPVRRKFSVYKFGTAISLLKVSWQAFSRLFLSVFFCFFLDSGSSSCIF
jgi:hypothetical protein